MGVPADSRAQLAVSGDISGCHNQETAAGVAGGQWVEARGAGRCCTTRRTAPPPPPTPRKNRLP